MLWNYIYEFYVKYIFGGVYGSLDNSTINYYYGYFSNDGNSGLYATTNTYINLFNVNMPIGNYFSLIATIISIIIILVLMCLIVKKIFNIIFRLFTGSSVF